MRDDRAKLGGKSMKNLQHLEGKLGKENQKS